MERILLLTDGSDWESIREMTESAKGAAAAPEALSFGLCLTQEPDPESQHAMSALGSVLFLCGGSKWQSTEALWQGEEYLLMADPSCRFLPAWDRTLLRWARCARKMQTKEVRVSALTGFPPCPADQLFAMRAVAASALDEQFRLHFDAGASLNRASAPVPAFFLNPDFCFAPAAFFRKMAEEGSMDFLSARRRGETLFTLPEPVCTAGVRADIPPVDLSRIDERSDTVCRRSGILIAKRHLEPVAKEGIGYPDLRYPVRFSLRQRILSRLTLRPGHMPTPMCITSCVSPAEISDDRLMHFRYLSAIEDVAVVCYAAPVNARKMALVTPNLLEYRPQYALPLSKRTGMVNAENYARLCRPFLLSQARDRFLTNSHYVWIDFDYLGYRVFEREPVQWETLCTDKITLAVVHAVPDTSMIVVPEDRIQPLCREILITCDACCRTTGSLPDETELWQALIQEHTDWFDLIELPGKRELLGLAIRSVNESWKNAP